MNLTYSGNLDTLLRSRNIAKILPEEDISTIGMACRQGYIDDKQSRSQWEAWYAEALKLALQVKEAKSFPWPNASNIKFPLLTIAALNFHAKAYPAIVNGESVVKCRVLSKDSDGSVLKRAERVGKHMSYQLLECSPWEEQTDKLLLVMAIMGTAFKKTVRDNNTRQNCSDLVIPQDLVVNYYTTDLETSTRVSHRFTLSRNELRENINAKLYREPEAYNSAPSPTGPLEDAKNKSQKLSSPNESNVHFLVEQSCFIDLDGDGYEEPYAVTFDEQTGFVYRIIARYYASDIKRNSRREVLRIKAENYYTKFGLIPSPDGGFYDMGLGLLLGPLTESVSTLINQITDWATMSITAGGFLGRGVRMKAGETTFKPLEWKTVDSTGDDLHKNIVPLPVKDLSPVLLDLLKFLVNYGERVAGSGDIQVGEIPGQNVKAGTMQIANENGRLIFNAIFKRVWRSLKVEFKKLYRLNQFFQEDDEFVLGERYFQIQKSDYQYPDSGIVPAADPNIVSKTERRQQVDMLAAKAAQTPGYDKVAVEKMWLEAYDIPGADVIYDPQKFPPPPNPKMLELQVKQSLAETKKLDVQQKAQVAVGRLMKDVQESQAKIMKMTAEALLAAKQADGVDKGHQIALLDAMIGAEHHKQDKLLEVVGMLMESLKDGPGSVQAVEGSGRNAGVLPLPVASPALRDGGVGEAKAPQ